MLVPRLLLAGLLATTACGGSPNLAQGADLPLPEGDRVVRTQPGACEKDCVVSDAVYESVTEVEGPERSDEEVGQALTESLAGAGWEVMPDGDLNYGAGADEVQHPTRWQRDHDGRRSYVFLFPLMPGSYGLAYDADGDSLEER